MSKRSKARELAMQMLFLIDMNNDIDDKIILNMIQDRLEDEELVKLSWSLYSGTMRYRTDLDAQIKKAAKNWSISRMAITDRNLLRLGCFELNHMDTPSSVVINEAVKLAKKFGAENSSSFINGILDKLSKEFHLQSESAPATAAIASPGDEEPEATQDDSSTATE
ncbi:MAG: transcription antitermination factor NusB [Planctomycetaceae bacterium]|nr:transcription antitermination factor NusB [Planctomycetaceae bacterium]